MDFEGKVRAVGERRESMCQEVSTLYGGQTEQEYDLGSSGGKSMKGLQGWLGGLGPRW